MEETPARAMSHRANVVRYGAHRALLAGLVVVAAAFCAGVAACGRAEAPAGGVDPAAGTGDAASQIAEPGAANPSAGATPPGDPLGVAAPDGVVPAPESPAPRPPAPPVELSSPEHQRYQQLRLETLQSMIDAAKLALPIGPFQQRIDAAAGIALEDVSAAGDLMEQIVADLREAIAAAGR